MKTKQFLFLIISVVFLLVGSRCNKKPDKPEIDEICFDCYESKFEKNINNITGIVVFDKRKDTFIISVNEDDINGINSLEPEKWNSSDWSYTYIPCPELQKEYQQTGIKVIISGELFSCMPEILPYFRILPSGKLLKNYEIRKVIEEEL